MTKVTVTKQAVYYVPADVPHFRAAQIALQWDADGVEPHYLLDSIADVDVEGIEGGKAA